MTDRSFRSRSTFPAALLASVSAAALLLGANHGASARQPGINGQNFSAVTNAATSAITSAQQAASAAQQSMNSFSRATQAIQAMQAAQNAARNLARGASSGVPNGLSTGGLQVAPGVGTDPTLWQNANLPTQSTGNGQTTVTIQQTAPQAILNWQTFNVGRSTTVDFNQQGNSNWIALNRVLDPSALPSQILGAIKADGGVYLINHRP